MTSAAELVHHYIQALSTPLIPPFPRKALPKPAADAPLALLFSPHPDDECITGALPRRLQRQHGWRIRNIGVTLGSRPERKSSRRKELEAACDHLGWENEILDWDLRQPEPDYVHRLTAMLRQYRPALILYPHAEDGHPVHRATHEWVTAAVQAASPDIQPICVQTEFWHPMLQPNLLVECPPEDLIALVEALAFHVGETARNAYHLRLPAWMVDNVRRGAELINGPGSPAPLIPFGTLYHASQPMDALLGRSLEKHTGSL